MNGYSLLNALISRIYKPLQYGKAQGLIYLIGGGIASLVAPHMIEATLDNENLFFGFHLGILSCGVLMAGVLAFLFWRDIGSDGKIVVVT
jgi:hypothetical protein